jgi:hypothetical protein
LTRLDSFLDGTEKKTVTKDDLTSRLLHFCSKASPSVSDAMKVMENLPIISPKSRILLANCIKSLYDSVPDTVLPTTQAREPQNNALLGWLSVLVDDEERAINSAS